MKPKKPTPAKAKSPSEDPLKDVREAAAQRVQNVVAAWAGTMGPNEMMLGQLRQLIVMVKADVSTIIDDVEKALGEEYGDMPDPKKDDT